MNRADGFSSAQRLRKSGEFRSVRQSGKRIQSQHFSLYLYRRPSGPCRLGLTVSRKVGGAVQRNRVKRLLREFFRLQQHRIPSGLDISIIARPGAADLNYWKVCEEIAPLLLSPRGGAQ